MQKAHHIRIVGGYLKIVVLSNVVYLLRHVFYFWPYIDQRIGINSIEQQLKVKKNLILKDQNGYFILDKKEQIKKKHIHQLWINKIEAEHFVNWFWWIG